MDQDGHRSWNQQGTIWARLTQNSFTMEFMRFCLIAFCAVCTGVTGHDAHMGQARPIEAEDRAKETKMYCQDAPIRANMM